MLCNGKDQDSDDDLRAFSTAILMEALLTKI